MAKPAVKAVAVEKNQTKKTNHLKLVKADEPEYGEEVSRSAISDDLENWYSQFSNQTEAAAALNLSSTWFSTLRRAKINPKTGRPYMPGRKACEAFGLERTVHFHQLAGSKTLAERIAEWEKKRKR